MSKLKTALAAGVAFAVSVVTLRALRERRKTPRQEATEATRDALDEAGMAAEHAMAAASHARVAGEKAVETAREEYQDSRVAESTDETTIPVKGRRLRKAGKGWVRR